VFIPASFRADERSGFGSNYNNSVIGRLKPGVSATRADVEARELVRANAAELYPAALKGLAGVMSASAAPLRDEVVGRARTLLLVVFAAVALVLLIACADIASLMLARAMAREREIAVRSALGAGRGRLIRQLLAESALLSSIGSVLGLLLAVWLSRALVALAPSTLPRLHEIGLDARVLLFTAALTVVTAWLCGMLPALELTRTRGEALREGGRASSGRRERRIFGTLVAAQLAIAVVLLVGGGLLLRSFSKLMAVDTGFRVDRLLTLGISLPAQGYRDAASVRGFYNRLLDDLSRVPGVSAAGASTGLPLGVRDLRVFTIEQESPATRELPHSADPEFVAGRYFEALGIPLKRGRYLGAEDAAASEPVAVINETMARRFWGTSDPIGQRLAWGLESQHGPWMRIVGVVGDVKQAALNTETISQTYVPWMQVSDGMIADNVVGIMRSLRVALRGEVEPTALTDTVRARIRAIDSALPVTSVQTMSEIVQRSTAVPRFNALLVSLFAVLALLLAAIGTAGMLATSVSRRLRELGIRMALGAQRRTLLAMMIRQGMIPAAGGVVIGLATAWLVSRVLSSLLFGISPRDPITFVTVAGVLGVVALAACALPAWHGTRVDPLKVLRVE
jgi:predicted permease